MSWCGVLEHHALRTPDKPIAVGGGESVSYSEMVRRSAAVAAGLHARGVGAGDVVGLLSYNSVEFLVTIFAANHLGAIAMPINWRLAPEEVRYILEHSRAAALVCDRDLVDLASEAVGMLDRPLLGVCVSADLLDGWERFDDVATGSPAVERAAAAGDDIHRLMYTSGTTGRRCT